MPIDLASLAKDKRELEFEFGGMTMPITYKPSVMTGRFAQQLSDGETIEDLTEMVEQVIVDWDLKDGDTPVPVSAEALALLPTAMLKKMLDAISVDAGLVSPEGKAMMENRQSRRTRQTSTASNGSS
jgi:hypothetical protein